MLEWQRYRLIDSEVNVQFFGSIQPPKLEYHIEGQAEPFEDAQAEILDAEEFEPNDQQQNVIEEDNLARINDQP